MARIYKEGQGKWSRGLLVTIVMLGAIFALRQIHDSLKGGNVLIPLINFELDYRFLIHGPLLILAAIFSYWLFNRPATADFLIDTESELKNKVTWPSQKEEVNASIVVVVTVLLVAVLIFFIDKLFQWVSENLWY